MRTDRTIAFSVPALKCSCSYYRLIFNQMCCHSEILKRIANAFWLNTSFTDLEVCNEQEMKLKRQYSHVHTMLQSQRDGWRFWGWKGKKMTDIILFFIDGIVFSVYFFPLHQPTHWLSEYRHSPAWAGLQWCEIDLWRTFNLGLDCTVRRQG